MAERSILSVVLCGVMRGPRVLLIRRRKPPYQGCWGLVGGKMEPGETVAEAAERETREETRLDAEFERVKGVVNETLLDGQGTTGHFVLFVCRLRAPDAAPAAGEEGPLRWFSADELRREREAVIPTDYHMIETLLWRPEDDVPFVEACMKERGDGYEVVRFEIQ